MRSAQRLSLLLLFAAVACSTPAASVTSRPTAANPVPGRSAVLRHLVNIVDVRDSPAVSFLAASDGQVLAEQASVRTGSASTVRLDFSNGGMVGLAQNTSVSISHLGVTDHDPLASLVFGVGHIWVSLTSGQFQAQTPMGVVAVLGSYADVHYDPGSDPQTTVDDLLTIKCIEGTCTFDSGSGPRTIYNLQQLVVTHGGQTVTGPTDLPSSAVNDFLVNSPESAAVVPSLTAAAPKPTATPSATSSPLPTDTATTTPIATDTPIPTPTPTSTATRTRRPPAFLPSKTPAPSDTPLASTTDTPATTGTAEPSPSPQAPTATPS